MMRKLYSWILLLSICSQMLSGACLLGWYYLGNASFTARFCINIEQPAVMCGGQCQLTQLMALDEESQEIPQLNIEDNIPRSIYIIEKTIVKSPLLKFHKLLPIQSHSSSFPGRLFSHFVFHPPEIRG